MRAHLWADAQRPRFVDIVGPLQEVGRRQLRRVLPVRADRPDADLPGPGPTAATRSTVAHGLRRPERRPLLRADRRHRSTTATIDDRPRRRLRDHASRPTSIRQPWIKLEPDAVCAITRDYLIEPDTEPAHGVAASSASTATDEPRRSATTELARKFRAVRTWIEDQAKITPLALGEPNVVDEPYPVPHRDVRLGRGRRGVRDGHLRARRRPGARDRGRSPECAFWNLCLWNPFLHTYDSDYDRVTINGGQVTYEPDGSWTIVVADARSRPPELGAHPGPPRGRLWFRWFHPEATPNVPDARS